MLGDDSVDLQDDNFDQSASITICLLTTYGIDAGLVSPNIEPSPENGLRQTSWAMADKVTTVARERLGKPIGTLTSAATVPVAGADGVPWAGRANARLSSLYSSACAVA